MDGHTKQLWTFPAGCWMSCGINFISRDDYFSAAIVAKRVARLFPDHRAAEEGYFRRTGLFPIMHSVIVRREIQEKHPWVAQSLYKAFEEAKRLCYEDMQEAAALKYSLPWLLDEVERTQEVMGRDFWPYGLRENRHTVETRVQYSHEQGLAARRITPEELFADVTFDQYSIWCCLGS